MAVYVIRSASGEFFCRKAWSRKLALATRFVYKTRAAQLCPSECSIYQLIYQVMAKDSSSWLTAEGMGILQPPLEFNSVEEARQAIQQGYDANLLSIIPILRSIKDDASSGWT